MAAGGFAGREQQQQKMVAVRKKCEGTAAFVAKGLVRAIEQWDQHAQSAFSGGGLLSIPEALKAEAELGQFLVFPSIVAHHFAPAQYSHNKGTKASTKCIISSFRERLLGKWDYKQEKTCV